MENESKTLATPPINKKFNLKKILFLAFTYILVFFIGFFMYDIFVYEPTVESYAKHIDEWTIEQEAKHEEEIKEIKKQQEEFSSCNIDECLIGSGGWGTSGVAKLEGFYQTYEGEAWGEQKICDALLVTGGSTKLRNAFNEILEGGNTVNSETENGELLLNINLSTLDSNTIQKIKSSTKAYPISLTVLRMPTEGSSVEACYSFVEILKAEDI